MNKVIHMMLLLALAFAASLATGAFAPDSLYEGKRGCRLLIAIAKEGWRRILAATLPLLRQFFKLFSNWWKEEDAKAKQKEKKNFLDNLPFFYQMYALPNMWLLLKEHSEMLGIHLSSMDSMSVMPDCYRIQGNDIRLLFLLPVHPESAVHPEPEKIRRLLSAFLIRMYYILKTTPLENVNATKYGMYQVLKHFEVVSCHPYLSDTYLLAIRYRP